MEGRTFGDILRGLILLELYLTSVCVGSPPCMPDTDPAGRYTVSGGGVNIWSEGIPSGARVQVSVRCDQGAIAQPSVVPQCVNGTWLQPWPRCERPCPVPTNGNVLQFVNGISTMPITRYTSTSLPDGTRLDARCSDPGKFRLSGDQRRTCYGGQWTGIEPQCNYVSTRVLFYGAKRRVASNGTVIVFVYDGNSKHLDVMCWSSKWGHLNPRLTTPLANDGELQHWHTLYSHTKRLNPIAIDHSGTFTCSWKTLSHSVHVLFKAAECEAPTVPEHGRLQDGYRTIPRAIIPSGTTVSFVCEEGYRLVGSWRVTCQQGQWTDVPPMCTVNRCPELHVPTHAVMLGVYGIGRNIGDERIFHCYDGYVLRGETNNLRCMEGGNWSHDLPSCEAVVMQTSPCDEVRCASWERCVVTGPDTARCGCINPSSCLTSGPRECGTNGEYYTSECHLRALACLLDRQVDIADSDDVCINGVPNEDAGPPTQGTEIFDPAVDVSSSSSSFVDTAYEDIVPPRPPSVDGSPSQTGEEDSPSYYSSFVSLLLNGPNLNDDEERVGDTTQLPSGRSTRVPATSNISPEEGEAIWSTPIQSTGMQTSQTLSRPTRGVTVQSSNSSVSFPIQPPKESASDF